MTLHNVQKDGTNVDLIPTDGDAVAGTWNFAVDANQILLGYYSNSATHANNDQVTFPLTLGKGTYEVSIIYPTSNDAGKQDISLDGNIIINQLDQYSAGTVYNVIHRESAVVIRHPTKTISFTVNGKNAASSNYYVSCSLISFRRVA